MGLLDTIIMVFVTFFRITVPICILVMIFPYATTYYEKVIFTLICFSGLINPFFQKLRWKVEEWVRTK